MSLRWLRVVVVIVLYTIGVATTAAAECAWVLWGQAADPWNALVALPLGAWPSHDRCEQERRQREQAPPELRMAVYTCLPDTVDPRRGKEK